MHSLLFILDKMMGNTRYDASGAHSHGDAGIIPNALTDVFKLIHKKQRVAQHGEHWAVCVSFMEVYNEQVYDLLESTGKVLSLREDQVIVLFCLLNLIVYFIINFIIL